MSGERLDVPGSRTAPSHEAARPTSDDRVSALRVLLPADPGPTLLALDDVLAQGMLAVLPTATVVSTVANTGWPDPASAAVLVVDERLHDVGVVRRLLRPDGLLVVLGRRGPYVLYPDEALPETIWRSGWPVQRGTAPLAWLRRRIGLLVRRGPRLRFIGPWPLSLADEVLRDVAGQLGVTGRLVGVVTASHTVLRMRTEGADVAVRLSLVERDDLPDPGDTVADEVRGVGSYLPRVLARGTTRSHRWTATEWARGPSLLRRPRATRDVARRSIDALIDLLVAQPTGTTTPGWAERWSVAAVRLPDDVRRSWAGTMGVLDAGLPTAWCHGDLWQGNVLVDGDQVVVLDWDNSSRDAPAGLDRLLVLAFEEAAYGDREAPEILLRLVDAYDGKGEVLVAGRRWDEWSRPHRVALALAALVLHLRNRSHLTLSDHELSRHAAEVERIVLGPSTRGGADEPVEMARAVRATRGVAWLATNAVVVKTAQTVVLLTLAAVLAPQALGLVALGTLVANVAVVLAGLGTASALVRWGDGAERAARTAVTIATGSGVVLAAATWLGAPWLAAGLGAGSDAVPVIRGLTLVTPLLAVAAVTNELLRRRLAFLRRILPDTTASVVGAVVTIVLVADGRGVMAFVAGQVVLAVLTVGLTWCVHPVVRPGWDHDDARGLLDQGAPLAGAQLLQLVQLNVDYLIVSVVLGGVALGQYSLAFRIAFMPYLLVVVVIAGAAYPYLCALSALRRARAGVVLVATTLTVLAPLCVALAVLAEHLTLLGPEWTAAVPVLALLSAYAVLLGVGQLVQTVLNAAGRQRVSLALRLGHLLVLLATLSVVAGRGLVAVAVTQVVVAALVAALALLAARGVVRGFSLRALQRALRPAVLGVVVMSAVMLLVRLIVEGRPGEPVVLATVGSAGLAAYVAVVLVVRGVGVRRGTAEKARQP